MDKTNAPAVTPEEVEKLAQRLDNLGLAQYVRLSRQPGKILLLNFASGVARGLGFTIGTTLVLAVIYKILKHIISMNIPYLTDVLNDFVGMIQIGG